MVNFSSYCYCKLNLNYFYIVNKTPLMLKYNPQNTILILKSTPQGQLFTDR